MKWKHAGSLVSAALIVQVMTACSGSSNNGTSSDSASSPSASAGASASPSSSSSAAAPSSPTGEKVTLRVMDWADSEKAYREQFIKDFEAKYPNIKIEYTLLTVDQFQNTILTAIKSGDAPDLFPIPATMKLSTAVKEGWYQPLDAYLDDAFKSSFVDGAFTEGTTMLDGKIYSIPALAGVPSTLVFYNKKLFQEAGLDANSPPKTYSEFREAAKKITAAGKGKYYGIIEGGKQIGRWKLAATEWSALAGSGFASESPVSLKDGLASYDSKAMLGVFDLFKGLKQDGSYHPKTMSLSAPEARALFAEGQAGFIVQGEWNVGTWTKNNPDLDFGVMAPPVPDEGQAGYLPRSTYAPWIGLSASTKHPKEAAIYLKEYFSKDYQSVLVQNGDRFSILKDVNESSAEIPQFKQYYEIVQQYARLVPSVAVRNPEASAVMASFKDPKPGLGDILQGVVAGSLKDPAAPLKQLSGQIDKALDAAIDQAKAGGAKVERSDFAFSSWSPDKDFSAEDYQALK
ncbi:ABC transporter substrate-binding protein [Cohnella hashimotonis]|uniref:Sugar ABC transporter substrate-binding protein n=1 Tax=Cohnella hashimotonis TaxID=2826895 RepID=A0ABT6TAF0_9BACL|nr:sugar ABC transporter substrate-binding protein [Cohnella hashimotonis]MDI4643813.1 sugar ABC transporter substrate-binding protein [Cohnella hashimotonis]